MQWLDMTGSQEGDKEGRGGFERVLNDIKPVLVQAGGLSWKKVSNTPRHQGRGLSGAHRIGVFLPFLSSFSLTLPPSPQRPLHHYPPDFVLKPLPFETRVIERSYRELGFYERLSLACDRYKESKGGRGNGGVNWETDLLRRFSGFAPSYYGLITSGEEEGGTLPKVSYVMLRDTTASFSRPCVVDFKMGRQCYEVSNWTRKEATGGATATAWSYRPHTITNNMIELLVASLPCLLSQSSAPAAKIEKEKKKYPEQATFGFRVSGANIYDPGDALCGSDGYVRFDKLWGRGLKNREHLKAAIQRLFTQMKRGKDAEEETGGAKRRTEDRSERIRRHRGGVRCRIIVEFRRQLKSLAAWFKDNDMFHFTASSILFVYEGNPNSSGFDNCKLRVIDYAHVVKREGGQRKGRDDGFLDGLYTILRLVDEILKEQEKMGKLREDL